MSANKTEKKIIRKSFIRCALLSTFLLSNLTFNNAATASVDAESVIANERKQDLLHLLKQDCGSCHGMTLNGGLGPALTPKALTHKPTEFLVNTILHGRAGTAMPPWQDFITDVEAHWLVQQLQDGAVK